MSAPPPVCGGGTGRECSWLAEADFGCFDRFGRLAGQKLNAQMEIMAIDDARSAGYTIRGQRRVYKLQRERKSEIIYNLRVIMMDDVVACNHN